MKNLDLANTSNLDDSFSNVDGVATTFDEPTSTPTTSTKRYVGVSRSAVTIAPKSSVSIPVQDINTTTANDSTPLVTTPANTPPIFMGGGGGYPAPEESAERTSEEAKIFGLKPIYAYGLGALALGFIYFKYIKK